MAVVAAVVEAVVEPVAVAVVEAVELIATAAQWIVGYCSDTTHHSIVRLHSLYLPCTISKYVNIGGILD